MERFAPTVMVPTPSGPRAYAPEGWMWVLAFALRGCEWAVEEASTPEFRERVRAFLKDRAIARIQDQIEWRLDQVEALRKELKGLKESREGRP